MKRCGIETEQEDANHERMKELEVTMKCSSYMVLHFERVVWFLRIALSCVIRVKKVPISVTLLYALCDSLVIIDVHSCYTAYKNKHYSERSYLIMGTSDHK